MKKISLFWLPPAKDYLPSPAMTVLKQTLQKEGYDVQIIYWNILLEDIISKYFFNDNRPWKDEISVLGIFFSYIAITNNDKNALLKQELFLRTLKPQYASKTGFSYANHIEECVCELEARIKEILDKYSVADSLFVGMSMNLFQWIPSFVIGNILKDKNPGTLITVGGIGNRKQAEAYIKSFNYIDIASWGEGEQFIKELAICCSHNTKQYDIPQCFYKDNGNIIESSVSYKKYEPLDSLEYFDFSDFFTFYKKSKDAIMLPIEGARGCHWNRCHFCFLNQGYKYRRKTNSIIRKEIESNIREYSVFDFTFLDNDVIGKDLNSFSLLLDELISIKHRYPKFRVMLAEIVTRGINFELIKKMHLAGFIHVQIGYESPSDAILHKIDKKNSFASNLFFIKWANELHIYVGGMNVLRGLLEEELEDIKEGIENLHFLRFFSLGSVYKHEISSLAINDASRYFKSIDILELQNYYTDAVKEMLPADFIDKDLALSIYQYVRKYQLHAWDSFQMIEHHYASNEYKYKIIQTSKDAFKYIEYYNSAPIIEVSFGKNECSWKILEITNKNILTIDEIVMKLNIDEDVVRAEISKLKGLGILYVGKYSNECVSIINTSNFL